MRRRAGFWPIGQEMTPAGLSGGGIVLSQPGENTCNDKFVA